MKRILLLLVLMSLACVTQPAHAIWQRSESIEWWTNVSDVILVADVTATKKIDDDDIDLRDRSEYWSAQTVECKPTDVLKGKRPKGIAFRQEYWKATPNCLANLDFGTDRAVQPGERVLLFCARDAATNELKVGFWINLTKPAPRRTWQAAYDNDCRWMGSGADIVALVKKRVAKEDPNHPVKRRGVIVDFTDYPEDREFRWDFVRTADPEYKQVLITELRLFGSDGTIYNLISYPGKETSELIRPFLKDPTKATVVKAPMGDNVKTTVYPVRQMAYEALKLLGESPDKPEGYDADDFPSMFGIGFEDRVYFPYGDWKRIERPSP